MCQIQPKQEQFCNVLANITKCAVSESKNMFMKITFQNQDLPTDTAFDNALNIMSLKEHTFVYGILEYPAALVWARNINSAAAHVVLVEYQDLENILRLAVDCCVLLCQNL